MKNKNNFQTGNVTEYLNFVMAAKTPGISFTVSSRGIRADIDMSVYLKLFYMYLRSDQIESVFGNTLFPSKLYGGRPFDPAYALTEKHLQHLEEQGIAFTLTLTNQYFSEEVYQHSYDMLERHHRTGAGLNIVSDKLAQRIRKDFPLYRLNASVIKNLNSHDKIQQAFDIYDSVVIPMDKNDDDAFLENLPHKNRVILFGNAECAYNCPARTCYVAFSQEIQGRKKTAGCSRDSIPRSDLGVVYFDLHKLHSMGYCKYKLIPDKSVRREKTILASMYSAKR